MRKGGKKILLSDSFVKPYVKVEGLPDLLLRYERDKEFNESGSDGNYCTFELSSRGSYFSRLQLLISTKGALKLPKTYDNHPNQTKQAYN